MQSSKNPIDVYVGSRVRLRRLVLGMSQEKLAEKLDLTFQQVQKYEKGINRIGASRLFMIARFLKVPVQFFYDGYREEGEEADFAADSQELAFSDFINSQEAAVLCHYFSSISDMRLRKSMLDLIKNIALRSAPENDDG